MYIQNYAGPHKSKEIYKKKVQPLFEAAGIKVNLTGTCIISINQENGQFTYTGKRIIVY